MASCFSVNKMTFARNFLLMARNSDEMKKIEKLKLISTLKRNIR